jgi:hypothetical protein
MLHPANPLAASLRQATSVHLANAIERLGWHGSRVHEGIHQGRKSLRQARAILALGGPVLGPGAVLIDREVQQLNRDLSKWRDGQALVEAVGRLLKRETDPECMAILRRSQQEAARVRAELGHAAAGDDSPLPTMRKLLKTLLMALPSLAWRSITAPVMNAALARSGGRREEAIERALSDGKTNDWHRLRKRVRRLTQQYAVIEELGIDEIVAPSDTVKEQEQKNSPSDWGRRKTMCCFWIVATTSPSSIGRTEKCCALARADSSNALAAKPLAWSVARKHKNLKPPRPRFENAHAVPPCACKPVLQLTTNLWPGSTDCRTRRPTPKWTVVSMCLPDAPPTAV